MSEYADKQQRPARPQRQAQSHRKEARFDYPHLNFPAGAPANGQASGGSAQNTKNGPANASFQIGGSVDPARSKDLEVLRSVEKAAALL